jgi:hypothetical protein
MTASQRTQLAALVRQILATELPVNVSNTIFNAFYEWPGGASGQPEAMEVLALIDREVASYTQPRSNLPPWLQ